MTSSCGNANGTFRARPSRDNRRKATSIPRITRRACAWRPRRGGYRHLLCYWGALEASREDHVTKTLSWVPLAGSLLPDESQRLRIRLKAVVLDVESGQWKMVRPAALEDERLSAKLNRESSDQKQVARLKEAGYRGLVASIVESCGG